MSHRIVARGRIDCRLDWPDCFALIAHEWAHVYSFMTCLKRCTGHIGQGNDEKAMKATAQSCEKQCGKKWMSDHKTNADSPGERLANWVQSKVGWAAKTIRHWLFEGAY